MSFSQDVKTEIANIKISQNIKNVEIETLGYILSNVKDFNENMNFQNENKAVILRYTYILKNVLEFVIVEDDNVNKNKKGKVQYMLDIVAIEDYEEKINNIEKQKNGIWNEEEKISFLKGIFLGSGYVLNPKYNYHLELVVNNEKTADMIKKCIEDLGIYCKITKRKKQYVVYMKNGDDISNLLILLGASVSVIKFEQMRVIKDMNNSVNRSINCETGNLNKIMKSSKEQLEDIKFLQDNNLIGLLSQPLQELCDIRLKNLEYSLQDIAKILGISKSGVNNRFKKISKIVQEAKNNEKI